MLEKLAPTFSSLLNYVPNVPYVPTCQDVLRANVPTCLRAYVPNFLTCQRAITCYVPTCQRAKFLYVPTCHSMLRANMHSSCLPCANLPTCQFVVPSIRRQFLKFMAYPATNLFFLMLIFLRLPRVQLLNLKITSKLLGKILKHDTDIIHIENTVETFTITVQCQNIFN